MARTKTDEELRALLLARTPDVITDRDRFEAKVSFVYANLAIEDPTITRDIVRDALTRARKA